MRIYVRCNTCRLPRGSWVHVPYLLFNLGGLTTIYSSTYHSVRKYKERLGININIKTVIIFRDILKRSEKKGGTCKYLRL